MINKFFTLNSKFKETIFKIILAIIIIIISFVTAIIIRSKFLNKVVDKNNNENRNKLLYTLLGSLCYYFIVIIGIIIALSNFGFDLSTIFIAFGSLGLAIALAIQSTVVQIVSGFVILFFGYFNNGDLVSSGTNIGYVTDFNLLNTTLKDPTGISIVLPNSTITSSNFSNYTINNDIYFKLFVTISSNNKINYDILLNNMKTVIQNKCKYVTNKDNVVSGIDSIEGEGIKLFVKIPIKSKNYLASGVDSKIIIQNLLSDNNIILLDRSYKVDFK
jgi:small conductance mechanosensitive channel